MEKTVQATSRNMLRTARHLKQPELRSLGVRSLHRDITPRTSARASSYHLL